MYIKKQKGGLQIEGTLTLDGSQLTFTDESNYWRKRYKELIITLEDAIVHTKGYMLLGSKKLLKKMIYYIGYMVKTVR